MKRGIGIGIAMPAPPVRSEGRELSDAAAQAEFADMRPEAATQRKRQELSDHSAQALQLKARRTMMANSPRAVRMKAEVDALARAGGSAAQGGENGQPGLNVKTSAGTIGAGSRTIQREQGPAKSGNHAPDPADRRKEQARSELLDAIDNSDTVSGEDLEALLARLKEKYGLSSIKADFSNPEDPKIELYASPALIVGLGIGLGVVVIAGIGIAGYYLYKSVKYKRLINRLTEAGLARDQAETAVPIILRRVNDGAALDDALIASVQRQLGAAGKMEEMQKGRNLRWSSQTEELTGSLMGRWILDKSQPEPDPVGGSMNCFEVVMFSAYKMNYLSWQTMHDAYLRDQGRDGSTREYLGDYFRTRIKAGAERDFTPGDRNSPRPLRGDLVIFEKAESHTAMAAGSEREGSPEVFSLWNRPSNRDYLQRVTVAALLDEGAKEPVRFFSPNWA